jgi:hypothetical protein
MKKIARVSAIPTAAVDGTRKRKGPEMGPRRSLAFLHFARERAKKVCCLGGFACGGEDCSVILLEERNSGGNVLGVAQFAGDPEVGTEKRGG